MSHQKIIERIRNVENYTGVGSDNTSGNTLLDDIKEVLKEDRNNNISNAVEMNNYLYDMVEKGRCYVIQDFHNDLISKFKSLNNHMDPFRDFDAWKKFCYTFRNELEDIMNNNTITCYYHRNNKDGSFGNIKGLPPYSYSSSYENPQKRILFKEYYTGRITYDKLYADFGSLGTIDYVLKRYIDGIYQTETYKLDIALLLRLDMLYHLNNSSISSNNDGYDTPSSYLRIKNCRYITFYNTNNVNYNTVDTYFGCNINNTFRSSDSKFKAFINNFNYKTTYSSYLSITGNSSSSNRVGMSIGNGYHDFGMNSDYVYIFDLLNDEILTFANTSNPSSISKLSFNSNYVTIGDACVQIYANFAKSYNGSGLFRTTKEFMKNLKEHSKINNDEYYVSELYSDSQSYYNLINPFISVRNGSVYSSLYQGEFDPRIVRDTNYIVYNSNTIIFLEEDQNPEDVIIEVAYLNDERQIQKFEIKPSNIRKMTVEEYGF